MPAMTEEERQKAEAELKLKNCKHIAQVLRNALEAVERGDLQFIEWQSYDDGTWCTSQHDSFDEAFYHLAYDPDFNVAVGSKIRLTVELGQFTRRVGIGEPDDSGSRRAFIGNKLFWKGLEK